MLTGNKGEWSEIYTLLKIIADKQIIAGDSNLNTIENLIFPVIKVLREESNGTFVFSYDKDLVVINNEEQESRISINTFQEQAHFLLSKLQEKTKSTFSIPEIENFINSFNSYSIKAASTSKSDISIIIHDQRTGTNPKLGFSIKSQLGGASTLLNAARTTNFIYQISGENLSAEQIAEINAINTRSKIKDRIEKIQQTGKLEFRHIEYPIFENNLTLIDSLLPKIIAEILLLFSLLLYPK